MKNWVHIKDEIQAIAGVKVRVMEPMSRHTTLMIGGPVDLFVEYESADALTRVLARLEAAGCPWLAAGSGSNLLVMDEGIEGAVLVPGSGLNTCRFDIESGPGVRAGAGTAVAAMLAAIARRKMGGLEYLTGIPGTVGGAVAMNAGTRYGYVEKNLISVEVVSAKGQQRIEAEKLGLGYRSSTLPSGSVVVFATFSLSETPSAEGIECAEILATLRRENHPPASGTAGSFFKNPDPEAGLFAGQLIEQCGLKGFRVGNAVVAQKHANFLMNGGKATAEELLELALRVRTTVLERTGVELLREVRLIGRNSMRWISLLP